MSDEKQCKWIFYKGLFHRECCSFLTTTECGRQSYVSDSIPEDGRCPDCGHSILQVERQFGCRRVNENKIKKSGEARWSEVTASITKM